MTLESNLNNFFGASANPPPFFRFRFYKSSKIFACYRSYMLYYDIIKFEEFLVRKRKGDITLSSSIEKEFDISINIVKWFSESVVYVPIIIVQHALITVLGHIWLFLLLSTQRRGSHPSAFKLIGLLRSWCELTILPMCPPWSSLVMVTFNLFEFQ